MQWTRWAKRLYGLLRPGLRRGQTSYSGVRGQITHVIILDGTMSSLDEGCESNAGLTYKLLNEVPDARLSLYYEAGVQWLDWRSTRDVIMGRGINRQIRRAYGYLASRYREGDRVILMGFSRGAYAVRSLAGVIDHVGLLHSTHATERNIMTAYRHYQAGGNSSATKAFAAEHCHDKADIEMVGVWDTVKALGLRLPIVWRWTEPAHAFHNHRLGPAIRHGYHALALDETRQVYAPVLWNCPPEFEGEVEQVWFRGSHGDIGGQLGEFLSARPLSNIPLVWMLEKLERHGVSLPEGWRERFPTDPLAQSSGTWRGWGRMFLLRAPREVGRDRSERLHESAGTRDIDLPGAASAV